jgi:hypothetical protein
VLNYSTLPSGAIGNPLIKNIVKNDKLPSKKGVKNDQNIKKGLQESNLEAFFDVLL